MKYFLFIAIYLLHSLSYSASDECLNAIDGYKIVKGSVYPFTVDNKEACFFAYYMKNPEPLLDARGNGNMGDTIWYSYFYVSDPFTIYKLPRPADSGWTHICNIKAVSFQAMKNNFNRDITIIGACNKYNVINYNFTLVFLRQHGKYVFDEDSYDNLFALTGLTIGDVKRYYKEPKTYYKILVEEHEFRYPR